jgi:hypothetical protein
MLYARRLSNLMVFSTQDMTHVRKLVWKHIAIICNLVKIS